MTTSLAQLIVAQDQPTILQNMYTLAASLGVDVVGLQAERLFRALYEIEATAKSVEESFRVNVAMGAFLDLAAQISPYSSVAAGKTTWLDLLAAGYYLLERSPATKTVGTVHFTATASATGGSIQAGAVTVSDSNGNRYQNVNAFTVVPGATTAVLVKALVAGTAGNVANGTIKKMVTTVAGVTCNNIALFVTSWIAAAATDAETNGSLINRCRARWSATSYGGCAGAYAQWINEAFTTTGKAATISRQSADDTNPNGPGSTDIYLANAAGPANVTEVGIVNTYLQPRRGLGRGPLRVLSSPAFNVPLSITVYGNQDTATITQTIANVFSNTPLGGTIFIDALTSAILALPGAYNAPIGNGSVNYASGATIKVPIGYVPVKVLTLTTLP